MSDNPEVLAGLKRAVAQSNGNFYEKEFWCKIYENIPEDYSEGRIEKRFNGEQLTREEDLEISRKHMLALDLKGRPVDLCHSKSILGECTDYWVDDNNDAWAKFRINKDCRNASLVYDMVESGELTGVSLTSTEHFTDNAVIRVTADSLALCVKGARNNAAVIPQKKAVEYMEQKRRELAKRTQSIQTQASAPAAAAGAAATSGSGCGAFACKKPPKWCGGACGCVDYEDTVVYIKKTMASDAAEAKATADAKLAADAAAANAAAKANADAAAAAAANKANAEAKANADAKAAADAAAATSKANADAKSNADAKAAADAAAAAKAAAASNMSMQQLLDAFMADQAKKNELKMAEFAAQAKAREDAMSQQIRDLQQQQKKEDRPTPTAPVTLPQVLPSAPMMMDPRLAEFLEKQTSVLASLTADAERRRKEKEADDLAKLANKKRDDDEGLMKFVNERYHQATNGQKQLTEMDKKVILATHTPEQAAQAAREGKWKDLRLTIPKSVVRASAAAAAAAAAEAAKADDDSSDEEDAAVPAPASASSSSATVKASNASMIGRKRSAHKAFALDDADVQQKQVQASDSKTYVKDPMFTFKITTEDGNHGQRPVLSVHPTITKTTMATFTMDLPPQHRPEGGASTLVVSEALKGLLDSMKESSNNDPSLMTRWVPASVHGNVLSAVRDPATSAEMSRRSRDVFGRF